MVNSNSDATAVEGTLGRESERIQSSPPARVTRYRSSCPLRCLKLTRIVTEKKNGEDREALAVRFSRWKPDYCWLPAG